MRFTGRKRGGGNVMPAIAKDISNAPRDRRRDNLLRIKDVMRRTGLSSSTIYRRSGEGTFPTKVMIGPSCAAWYESEIDDFVEAPERFQLPHSQIVCT